MRGRPGGAQTGPPKSPRIPIAPAGIQPGPRFVHPLGPWAPSMILVTGATGTTGIHVVRELTARGVRVRALVRNFAKIAGLSGHGVEIAGGDLSKPDRLEAAFRGVESLFLASTADIGMADLQSKAIAVAKRAGVRHVVRLSALGASADSPVGLARIHHRVDTELVRSGLAWTLLKPNFYMQNVLGSVGSMVGEGKLYAPAGNGRASLIDARDVAAVAVAALLEPGHRDQTYALTGPEPLSYADLAHKISAAIGKEITYVDLTADSARRAMLAAGMAAWPVEQMVALFDHVYAPGLAAPVLDGVQAITGRPPRTFDAFAHDYSAALAGRAAITAH